LSCSHAGDASLLKSYINHYANHPNQLFYQGKQVVSSFSGESCTFGQGSLNAGWNYAVKTGVSKTVSVISHVYLFNFIDGHMRDLGRIYPVVLLESVYL
jgi:hypothetical protein